MIRFRVIATKTNLYGHEIRLSEIRRAVNAWELSEQLRDAGWEKRYIKQINEERLKYSQSRYKSMVERNG